MLAPMNMWNYVTSARGKACFLIPSCGSSWVLEDSLLKLQDGTHKNLQTLHSSPGTVIRSEEMLRPGRPPWAQHWLLVKVVTTYSSSWTREDSWMGTFKPFFFFGSWDQHFLHKSVVWNLLIWLSNTFSAMHHVFKPSPACLPTTQVLLLLLRCHLFRWTSWGQEFPAGLSPLHHQWDEMATWPLVSAYPHVVGTWFEKEGVLHSTRTECISKKMSPGQVRSRKQMMLRSS